MFVNFRNIRRIGSMESIVVVRKLAEIGDDKNVGGILVILKRETIQFYCKRR